MEPGMNSSRLIGDFEIAIELLKLTAQSSEAARHSRAVFLEHGVNDRLGQAPSVGAKDEGEARAITVSSFGFLSSFVIRHSDFICYPRLK